MYAARNVVVIGDAGLCYIVPGTIVMITCYGNKQSCTLSFCLLSKGGCLINHWTRLFI